MNRVVLRWWFGVGAWTTEPGGSSGISTSRTYLRTVIFYFKSLQISDRPKATVV